MASYLRLDKVNANDYIESFVSNAPIVNGQFLKIKKLDLEKGQEVVVVEKAEAGKKPDLIAGTAFLDYGADLNYDITKQELAVGKVGRAFHLVPGQRFAFHKDQVAGAGSLQEGDKVTVNADGNGIKKSNGSGDFEIGVFTKKEVQPNVGEVYQILVNF